MARRTTKATATPAPEPEPAEDEETTEGGAVRGPGEMHELFAEFLKETTGEDVDPHHIFLVTSKRTAFRKSDAYLEFAEAQDEERDKIAAAKEERRKAREEAKATEPADGEDAPAPKARGRRAKAEAPAETGEEAAAPAAPRARGRRAAAKPAVEDPAAPNSNDAEVTPIRGARRRRSAPAVGATTDTGKKPPF